MTHMAARSYVLKNEQGSPVVRVTVASYFSGSLAASPSRFRSASPSPSSSRDSDSEQHIAGQNPFWLCVNITAVCCPAVHA